MTAPGNSEIIILLVLGIVVSSSYAIGRIQQWYQHGIRRDEAYRTGYDRATSLMFTMVNDASAPAGAGEPGRKRADQFLGRAVPHRASVPAQAGSTGTYRHVSGAIAGPGRKAESVRKAESARKTESGRKNESSARHRRVPVRVDSAGAEGHPANRPR